MTHPPAIVSISSHVARGSVGNRATVFACETLGLPVWSVNTISLPFHPGHGRATRIVPDPELFSAYLDDLMASPWIDEVGAVLTGYMAEPGQAIAAGHFIAELRQRKPDLIYLCDPVIGDKGGLYVSADVASAIRDHLLPKADLATPNLHELAWLAGAEPTDALPAIAAMARRLGLPRVVVTSSPGLMRGHIANLMVDADSAILAEHARVDGPPNGAGDLAAALLLAHIVLGEAPRRALEKTASSVFEIVARAARRGSNELMLATDRASILRAMAPVDLRQIVVPAAAR